MGFYIISISSKNPPAKSLHRFYTVISDFYTVPTSYLYRFFDFYITSISLKISIVAGTISLLYHFSDFYIIAISKRTSIISILYHWGLLKNYHDKTNFSKKIGAVSRPIQNHTYIISLCRNSDIIYKPNHFIVNAL